MMTKSYSIAVSNVEDESIVSRSRFICYLTPCTSNESAKAFVKDIIAIHPQASHHCYAFITGAVDDSQGYGFSDDGEPGGTAGRPMLAVLQGNGVGQVCAVVVRYFGGTKLGMGGLQRAYGGSVRQALVFLQSKTKIAVVHKSLACQYNQVNDILHIIALAEGQMLEQSFLQDVEFIFEIPQEKLRWVQDKLQTLSAGFLVLKSVDE